MSHYVVVVVGEDVEEQLAPFNEQTEDVNFLEFNDVEDEYKKKYEEETTEQVELADGRRFYPWDDVFKVVDDPKKPFQSRTVHPADSKKIEVPLKEIYPTFEEFMKEYAGYKNNNKFKRYGYWHNPNAKWDWYQIGGRWSGSLKLKKGEKGTHGEKSWANKDEETKPDYVDQARKGQIDFEGMKNEAGEKAEKHYNLFESIFHGHIPQIEKSWEEIRDSEEFKDNIQGARDAYHNQPSIKLYEEIKQKVRNDDTFTKDDKDFITWSDLTEFQCTKEEFIQRARNSSVSFYAVLMNGKWYEKGTMGWWGISYNEKDINMWHKQQADLFDGVSDDTLITIVDCHI